MQLVLGLIVGTVIGVLLKEKILEVSKNVLDKIRNFKGN
jgi:hypothetical protein